MDYLVSIIRTAPLNILFSFYNPARDESACYVPRMLEPLGYFVSLTITDANNAPVYETIKPDVRLDLHPERPDSYQALDPGYTYGRVLVVEDFSPDPGTYHLSMVYSNQEYRGFPGHSLGEMSHTTMISFQVI